MLTPSGSSYSEAVLYSFNGPPADVSWPQGGVIADPSGKFFGTAKFGGTGDDGGVFEITLDGSSYGESVLYSFSGGNDGTMPAAGLSLDSKGDLYCETQKGGKGNGVVFELVQKAGMAYRTLYRFTGGADGGQPYGAPLLGAKRALFSSAFDGGTGLGEIFQISR